MIIKQGLTDVSPLARGIATLAAHPAPLVTPELKAPPAGANGLLAHGTRASDAALAEAMRNGMLSAPQDDAEFDKQVEGAIRLALSVLSKRPSGAVGIALFAAQLAGVSLGIAATRTHDPGLLKFAKGLQTGTKVTKGMVRGDLVPAAEVAMGALIDAVGQEDDVTSAARYLDRRPRELTAAVVDAAGVLAALPPEDAGRAAGDAVE